MFVTSLPFFKSRFFSAFFTIHHLFLIAIPMLIIHGLREWVQVSHEWRYLLFGTCVYLVDRSYRLTSAYYGHKTKIVRARIATFPIFDANFLNEHIQRAEKEKILLNATGSSKDALGDLLKTLSKVKADKDNMQWWPQKEETYLIVDILKPNGTYPRLQLVFPFTL